MQEGFRYQLAEVGRLQQASLAKGHRQEAALQQARQETLEAVQQGNHKYATMLAERMGIEDELKHQLASKQQAAAARSAACACNHSRVVQESHTMHVVTHVLTTITHQSCLGFVIQTINHPRLSCRQCLCANIFAGYNMSCRAANCCTNPLQATRPTNGEISMGKGKASFGRAGGVCQGRVAKQVEHGCG